MKVLMKARILKLWLDIQLILKFPRAFFGIPFILKDVESYIKSCDNCQK